MYLTRFGYFVIISIVAVAVGAVVLIVWPFGGEDGNGGGPSVQATATVIADGTEAAPTATTPPLPALTFEQVVNFASFGAVVDIRVTGEEIIVNLRPDFDVSGLGTTSHTFTTTLPPGANSVEAALQAANIEVNGATGVPVIRQ